MSLTFILAMTGVAAYLAAMITALLFHGIWVAPFIERQGERTAGFFSHWMLGPTGLIRDYMTARRLCVRTGLRPFWMRCFTSVLFVAAVFAALAVATLLLAYAQK